MLLDSKCGAKAVLARDRVRKQGRTGNYEFILLVMAASDQLDIQPRTYIEIHGRGGIVSGGARDLDLVLLLLWLLLRM